MRHIIPCPYSCFYSSKMDYVPSEILPTMELFTAGLPLLPPKYNHRTTKVEKDL